MTRRILAAASVAGLALLAWAPPSTAESAASNPSADEQTLTVVLPKGDPEAGREAFRALMCGSCHAVAGVESSPPKVTRPVPVLGRVQARLEAGEIATSIISPSHEVSPEVLPSMEGELSPMGDFSEALTLCQLVDLVAYIRSLDGG